MPEFVSKRIVTARSGGGTGVETVGAILAHGTRVVLVYIGLNRAGAGRVPSDMARIGTLSSA